MDSLSRRREKGFGEGCHLGQPIFGATIKGESEMIIANHFALGIEDASRFIFGLIYVWRYLSRTRIHTHTGYV